MRVGIVGTGEMGRPLVHRMLAAGIDVVAAVRRPGVRAELSGAGASCVEHPHGTAAGSDVVVVYLHSDEQVREVVLAGGLADVLDAGSVLLVLTTGSPSTVEAIAARVAARGAGVVDAPGSGGPAQVASGTLTLFVGGDERHVARCRPVFDAFANRVLHLGGVGAGQRVKLLNNLLFGAHVELAVEAARLAEQFGIDPVDLAAAVHTASGQSYALDLVAATGSAGALVQRAGPYLHKDVQVAQGVATDLGVDLGTIAAVVSPLLERTRPDG